MTLPLPHQALSYFLTALAGGVLAIALQELHHAPVTHAAQAEVLTFPGCLTNVPKSWGKFVGASSYGLAFEDDHGTLRFVQHPACGSTSSAVNPPTAIEELEVVRK